MSADTPNRTALQSRLRELAARFMQRCLTDVAAMRERLADVRANDRAALAEIENLAHKMHGTAATLGHAEISGRSGQIERFVNRLLASEQPIDDETSAQLDALIARLEGVLAPARS
jgi:HPt (histidine-containing phosphotransfer) domain-containing protein